VGQCNTKKKLHANLQFMWILILFVPSNQIKPHLFMVFFSSANKFIASKFNLHVFNFASH
jgi:hypothetical protein